MQYYINVIKNYVNFKGRGRRREYWMFTLFNFIFGIVATILDNVIGDTFKNHITGGNMTYGYIYLAYGLFVFIPGLAVLVRRLHDVGKSGRLLLFIFLGVLLVFIVAAILTRGGGNFFMPVLIMIIGLGISIWLLVLLCTDSTPGPNKYGPNPKGIGNMEDFDFMKTTVS